MNILQALILGIVQGLCEFLPISSSGHLLLFEKLLGVEQAGLFMSVMLHLGTMVAVIIVLRQEIWALLRRPFQPMVGMLIVATLPAVAAALLFDFDAAFSGSFLGISFLITSALLFFTSWFTARRSPTHREVTWLDALIMGFMQAFAILPGVSRSGSTLVGGLLHGLERERAARFAFLMSIPAILGSLVLEVVDIAKGAAIQAEALPVIVGVLASVVCGIFAIRLMLWVVRQAKLQIFAIYTLVLGVLVIIDQNFTHIFF